MSVYDAFSLYAYMLLFAQDSMKLFTDPIFLACFEDAR